MPLQNIQNYPPELWAQIQQQEERKRLTEAMTMMAMKGVGQPPQGGMVQARQSPLTIPLQAAMGYMAGKSREGSVESAKQLGDNYSNMTADAIQNYTRQMQGSPEIPMPSEEVGGGPGRPAQAPNSRGAIIQGMMSRVPQVQKLAAMDYSQLAKPPVRTDLGDRVKVEYPGGRIEYEAKGTTPDAKLSDTRARDQFAGVSGNIAATLGQARELHDIPTGSARLGASVSMRGQDIGASTAMRGQNMTADTAREGQRLANDPTVQGNLAGARKFAQDSAENDAAVLQKGPTALANAQRSLAVVDQMIGDLGKPVAAGAKTKPAHPGFGSAVGFTWKPGMRFVEGSKEADFMKLLEQAQGGAFLQAYEGLKGTGTITEKEGEKATVAITRMSKAQSEKEFVAAVREYEEAVRPAMTRTQEQLQRAQKRAGGGGIPAGSTLRFDAQGNLIQ